MHAYIIVVIIIPTPPSILYFIVKPFFVFLLEIPLYISPSQSYLAQINTEAFEGGSVAGLPPHLGGVACALGPQQWTNNSTGLLDIK